MPDINQAMLIRDGIVILQYAFLVLIYFFVYRIGKLLYIDLCTLPLHKLAAMPEAVSVLGSHIHPALVVLESGTASGLKIGERITLKSTTMIGRNTEHNVLTIHETFVSAEHALIQQYKDRYWISDLKSRNGTFVNDMRIEDETPLTNGDKIKIGSVVLRFEG